MIRLLHLYPLRFSTSITVISRNQVDIKTRLNQFEEAHEGPCRQIVLTPMSILPRNIGFKHYCFVGESSVKNECLGRSFCLFGLLILVAPLVVATVAVSVEVNDDSEPQGWWTETTVDRNQNKIGDMVELHGQQFSDEDNTLPLIIDFHFTTANRNRYVREMLTTSINSFYTESMHCRRNTCW